MKWFGDARREADSARQDVIDQMGDRADKRAAEAKDERTLEEQGFATPNNIQQMIDDSLPYTDPLFLPECDARHPEWPKVKRLCTMVRGHSRIEGHEGAASWDHKSERKDHLTVTWNEQDVPRLERTVFRIKIDSRDIIGLSAYARLKQTEMAEETGENMQKLRVENVVPVTVSGRRMFKGETVFETWRPGT